MWDWAIPVTRQSRADGGGSGSRAALVLVAVATILAGCSGASIPPTYTQDELKAICERHGGWWHPDGLVGGYCEYQSDGFL
jgi:hypothetical protein